MKPRSAFGETMEKIEELRIRRGADFLDDLAQVRLGGDALLRAEQRPLAVLDAVEEVQDVPALGGHHRIGVLRCHRWGKMRAARGGGQADARAPVKGATGREKNRCIAPGRSYLTALKIPRPWPK